MARDDADFDAYLAARWPPVVRSLVLIGSPRDEAERLARAGLARCRTSWEQVRGSDDVDAYVYRTVLDGWHASRRVRPWRRAAVAPPPPPPPGPDATDPARLCHALLHQLSGLAPESREALVLRLGAGLDGLQVADVLDVPVATARSREADALDGLDAAELREAAGDLAIGPGPMTERLAEHVLRTAAEAIDVDPVPVEGIVVEARQQRRRRLRAVAGGVAAALVVGGAVAWATTRPTPPSQPVPVHVVPLTNPVGTAWYAEGRLHLSAVAVDVPDLTDVAAVGEGVAYLDQERRVGLVNADGTRTIVGTAVQGSAILGSAENGWAAWIAPEPDRRSIVVWSIGLGAELARMPVPPDTELVAIDQDRVYFQGADGAFSWAAGEDAELEPLGPPQLVDVASATRAYQLGHRIEMVQPFFSVSYVRRGEGATVSPGGAYVLSGEPGTAAGTPYTPLLYDTRSGLLLDSGVARDERVVDAAFGPHHDLTYLVVRGADLGGADLDGNRSRLLVLRTCALPDDGGAAECHDVVPVPTTGGRAMFAH